jgi:hypothetical protein
MRLIVTYGDLRAVVPVVAGGTVGDVVDELRVAMATAESDALCWGLLLAGSGAIVPAGCRAVDVLRDGDAVDLVKRCDVAECCGAVYSMRRVMCVV